MRIAKVSHSCEKFNKIQKNLNCYFDVYNQWNLGTANNSVFSVWLWLRWNFYIQTYPKQQLVLILWVNFSNIYIKTPAGLASTIRKSRFPDRLCLFADQFKEFLWSLQIITYLALEYLSSGKPRSFCFIFNFATLVNFFQVMAGFYPYGAV